MTRPVVGFVGRAGCGKDTAALALVPYGFKRVSFADPLKRAAIAIDPFVKAGDLFIRLSQLVDDIGWTEAKKHEDVRRFLQRLGTEGGRNVHGPECWTSIAQDSILDTLDEGFGTFTPDVRFPNEVELLQSLGGVNIFISRPGVEDSSGHVSESLGSSYCDAMINNSSTVEELHKNVIVICKRLGVLDGS